MSREMEERNIKFIQTMFEATSKGDWETAEKMVTSDFFVIEADSLPFAGVFRGIKGMQELYSVVMSSTGVTGIDTQQITAGGDYVVVLAELVLEGTPPVRVPLAETFRFRDGKVCQIKPYYFDPRPVCDAVAARKKAARA
jgi:ketosteroid isomerase-like protein